MRESDNTFLLQEFRAALLKAGSTFTNLSKMDIPTESQEALDALLKTLEKNFSGKMSPPEQGRKINVFLNNDTGLTFKMCKPFEGMKLDRLSSIFQLPIFVIEVGDIKASTNEITVLQNYQPQPNEPFAEQKTIFIWSKDPAHNFLLYTQEELSSIYVPAGTTQPYGKRHLKKPQGKVTTNPDKQEDVKAASNPMKNEIRMVYSAPKEEYIHLGCKHLHIIKAAKDCALELKKKYPSTDLVLKCPVKLCFYITKVEEAKKILEDSYDFYFKTDKVNFTKYNNYSLTKVPALCAEGKIPQI